MSSRNLGYVLILCVLYMLMEYMPDQNDEVKVAAESQEAAMEVVETDKKTVAITFDDGPGAYTMELLEGLSERNVKATFFLLGEQIKQYPETVKRMQEDGHCIGNHTYSHVNLSMLSETQAIQEIENTNQLIMEICGEKPAFLRPPFGACSSQIREKLDMMIVLWDVDPLDWTTKNVDAVVSQVVTNVSEDNIILLHDIYESSVDAALEIIDFLLEKGYEFVTVEELMFP